MSTRGVKARGRTLLARRSVALPIALFLGAAVCATLAAGIILAHQPTIMNIYQESELLKEQKWNYEKHDLPSAKVRHPVLMPEAWWARPRDEWAGTLESWPEEKRKAFPRGVADMEAAHEKMVREARESVADIMKISEEDLLKYVPRQSPVGPRKNYCPACGKGKLVWSGPPNWDKVRCSACGMVFPNERFPAERKHALGDPLGRPVIFRYYRDDKGFNHFFRALTYGPRRDKMMKFGLALARAYHVTREPAFARRAALLLDQLATAFPHWCMRNGSDPHIYVLGEGWHSGTGEFDRWSGRWMFGVPYECVSSYEPIYDMIYESDELDRLSEERKYDVRRHIERDLFYENITVFISADPFIGPVDHLMHISVMGMIRRGQVLNDPGLIHRSFAWAEKRAFNVLSDGTYAPRPGDTGRVLAGLDKVVELIAGWTDPPDTKDNKGTDWSHELFVDFDATKRFPVLAEMQRFPERIAMPNGLAAPVNGIEVRKVSRPRDGRCEIFPAWGHAVLGAGGGKLAVESHLHFGGDYGDGYRDGLGTMLYAFGREMLSDAGAGAPRGNPDKANAEDEGGPHTLCHNTVVIDRLSQAYRDSGLPPIDTDGSLLMYIPTLRGLSAVEARAERGYPGAEFGTAMAHTYRRMQVLVSIGPNRPYVVDIFRVAGGDIHDYVVHGSCADPMTAETTLPLSPGGASLMEGDTPGAQRAGEDALESSAKAYGLLKEVRHASTSGGWQATFRFTDRPSLGVRMHGLGGAGTELFLARAPYKRHPKGEGERPCLIARRSDPDRGPAAEGDEGAEGLSSVFVTVIEPFGHGPGIRSVESVKMGGSEAGDGKPPPLALRIRWNDGKAGGRTDTLLVCPEGLGPVRTEDGIEFDGRIGLVSETGASSRAYLVGGTALRKGALALEVETGTFKGSIEETLRTAEGKPTNALVTRDALPVGTALRGSFIVLTMPRAQTMRANDPWEPMTLGVRIDRIERDGERTIVHTDGDHGLRMTREGGIATAYAPRRLFLGKMGFTIHNAVSTPDVD